MPIEMVKFIVKYTKRFIQCDHIGKRDKSAGTHFKSISSFLKWGQSLNRGPRGPTFIQSGQGVVLPTTNPSCLGFSLVLKRGLTSCWNSVESLSRRQCLPRSQLWPFLSLHKKFSGNSHVWGSTVPEARLGDTSLLMLSSSPPVHFHHWGKDLPLTLQTPWWRLRRKHGCDQHLRTENRKGQTGRLDFLRSSCAPKPNNIKKEQTRRMERIQLA